MKLAVGTAHACVVSLDGRVRCWGVNDHGQLGVGDREERGSRRAAEQNRSVQAVDLGRAGRVKHIACGGSHCCVIFEDDRVRCWGNNGSGQLGIGDRRDRGAEAGDLGDSLPFVDLGGRAPIALALGSRHSCALIEGGWVKCWGANELGQLGLGDDRERGVAPHQMGEALGYVDLGGEPVLALGAGANHTCAVLARGTVKCWGMNGSGQLGVVDRLARAEGRARGDDRDEMGEALPEVLLSPGAQAVAVSAGQTASCALLAGGAIECWGSNWLYQLGIGRTSDFESGENGERIPVNLGTGRTALAVSVGDAHACALLDDRRIKCWGNNHWGELGIGSEVTRIGGHPQVLGDAWMPVDLGTREGAPWLSPGVRLGGHFGCALLDGGAVKCWGRNDRGQLGIEVDGNVGAAPERLGDALPPVRLD